MAKRAVELDEYDRRQHLCADELCIRNPRYKVKDQYLCGTHAKQVALYILLEEEAI